MYKFSEKLKKKKFSFDKHKNSNIKKLHVHNQVSFKFVFYLLGYKIAYKKTHKNTTVSVYNIHTCNKYLQVIIDVIFGDYLLLIHL